MFQREIAHNKHGPKERGAMFVCEKQKTQPDRQESNKKIAQSSDFQLLLE